MRILAISDIHSNFENIKKLKLKEIFENFDLIILAGDITNFGNYEDAKRIVNEFPENKLIAIPGNCDTIEVLKFFEEKGINLHAKCKKINDLIFCGIGYSLQTPFNTPLELSKEEIFEILKKFEKCDVLISHTPPFNTKVDKTKAGINVGSKELRKFIEEKNPKLVICGHIHEATGIDKIGKSLIANVSALKNGKYGIIEINEKIDVKICSI